MSTADIIQKYQTILNNNGLGHRKVVDVVVAKPNLIGEHMNSECAYVTLKLANGEPDVELFVKEKLANSEVMQFAEKGPSPFDKEAEFFNVVLPDLQAYHLKNSRFSKPLDFYPKCFYASKQQIIMENLVKTYGYHMTPKQQRLDLEHATITVENLAQHHAVSYAMMKDLGGYGAPGLQKYNECMQETMYTPNNPFFEMIENGKTIALQIVNENKVHGADRAIRVLEKNGVNIADHLTKGVSPNSKNLCLVMNHGDFWSNNIMFLRDPVTEKLTHVVFVDFQAGRIGSPCLDLTTFIYSSVRADVRRESLRTILDVYYQKFCSFWPNPNFHISFDEFLAEFKSKSLGGFWLNILFTIVLEAYSSVDPGEIEGHFVTHFHNTIMKWLQAHPEKAKQYAGEIVDICDEYEQLMAE